MGPGRRSIPSRCSRNGETTVSTTATADSTTIPGSEPPAADLAAAAGRGVPLYV